jgi:hypothetical protein
MLNLKAALESKGATDIATMRRITSWKHTKAWEIGYKLSFTIGASRYAIAFDGEKYSLQEQHEGEWSAIRHHDIFTAPEIVAYAFKYHLQFGS